MPRRFTVAHSLRVVGAIGWSDFVLKYRGSFFGYLWSLAGPLVKFLVILYVFGPFVSAGIPLYPLYLFLGIILWEHFALTTTGCIAMLHDKQTIIQKLRFPRILLIFAVGWTNFLIFLTHFAIFLVFAGLLGVAFSWSFLYILLIFLQMTLLALGIGMLLSAYALRFRDIGHLWGVCTQVLFWLTPIMYPYAADRPIWEEVVGLGERFAAMSILTVFDLFVRFQPLSILIHDARRVAVFPDMIGIPTATHAIGFTVFCLVLFAAGAIVFIRRSRYFLQEY